VNIITADIETYYSKELGFKTHTTEAYIRHDDFHVIGISVADGDAPARWFSGAHDQIKVWLNQFDWENSLVLAHNTLFDGAILAWKFGIRPKGWLDTLCMARALHGVDAGGSLKALAERYGVGVKGTEVENALGLRRVDFSPEHLARYGEYCCNDTELTRSLFRLMAPDFPRKELKVIDATLRMFIQPTLLLDAAMLEEHLSDVKAKKARLLEAAQASTDDLMSNDKFAELLRMLGVEPPTKISARTGKEAWAFAKTDEAFKALLEHPDLRVQALVGARLGTKTTLEETRTRRLIDIAQRGPMPVPLKYYGARTGRWASLDLNNMMNIPRKSKIKQAIKPPEGHVLLGADLSNIELRVGLRISGQLDKLELLRNKLDLYKDFAASVFSVDYDAVDKDQRFIGKTCIAEGTLVLSDAGWKPIESITRADRLWDGEEWACHHGLISNGLKEVLPICGAWLTPDHQVWSGTSWQEAISLINDANILRQALDTAAASLPSQGTFKAPMEGSSPLSCDATVAPTNILSTPMHSRILGVQDACAAREQRGPLNDTGFISKLYRMTSIGVGCLTDWLRRLGGAITPETKPTQTMANGASQFFKNGSATKRYFLGTYNSLMAGITPLWIWTGSTTIKAISPATFGSYPEETTRTIAADCKTLRKRSNVYDIASVGTRNRFTIQTEAGPLIVHNCQLALIFGTGAAKLRSAIRTGSGVDIGEDMSSSIVSLYRTDYAKVKGMWNAGNDVLEAILTNRTMSYGHEGMFAVHGERGILLPSGLYMQYPGLRKRLDKESGKTQWEYDIRYGTDRIYGAKVFQGLTQAVARCIMAEHLLAIQKRYPVALTIHDALYLVVPEGEAERAQDFVLKTMRAAPEWLPDIPLDAEAGYGKSLADC
jgi:DNA polymerase I-like protein with 3'-5' exonuclease and polymerase domains